VDTVSWTILVPWVPHLRKMLEMWTKPFYSKFSRWRIATQTALQKIRFQNVDASSMTYQQSSKKFKVIPQVYPFKMCSIREILCRETQNTIFYPKHTRSIISQGVDGEGTPTFQKTFFIPPNIHRYTHTSTSAWKSSISAGDHLSYLIQLNPWTSLD